MKAYYEHSGVTLYMGDSLTCLRELPSESVNACITSPPYWGLRDYGTADSDQLNPGLRQRFYEVVDDLRESASIVDLWLLDISRVLKRVWL